ncbi:MAG TPA: M20/M25/M40 family metallo-hydrolase [Chitinophagales bacterium]|nr:M20/M25/M40 family metallo-hydrolase [Chitinophagales bacterium]
MMRFIVPALLILLINNVSAQRIDSALVKKHIYYLASDKLKGRAPGTKGEKLAATYIADHFAKYGLKPLGTDGYFQPFTYRQSNNPHDTVHNTGKKYTGRNIIGFLDNGAAKTIVIGAHFDHLGEDGRGSSLEKEAKGKIHNGADDNASGSAGVIELAHYLSNNNVTEKTNFLFMCFSAEEAGLIGSKYFTNNPTLPLEKVQCMLNMDMVGHLVDSTQKLMIYGVGTSDVFVDKLNALNRDRFKLVLDSAGVGPSDQTSFYLKKIPVLHFFTGQHSDYHKSGDDPEKINYTGEAKVLEYMLDIITDFSALPEMKFFETQSKESAKTSFKVTLGIMPDYSYQGKGLRMDAVNKDKPAEKAGLKDGDILIELGDVKIDDIYGYMNALSKFKKGDTVPVVVKRGDKTVKASVTF